MQKPITSRVKRSPLLKYSPAKEKKDGNVEAIGSKTTKGKDKKVIKKKESSYEGEKMSDEEWNALTPEKRRELNKAIGANKEGVIITETEETIPGEDKTVDTKLYRKDTQDVKEPWEVRRSNRSAKIQGRAQRRAQNKADQVARQLAKLSSDEKKPGNKKYDRLMAKQTETTQELENMKQGTLNVAEGRRSGKLAGSTIRREKDVVKTAADYEDPQQIQQAARREEIAAASGMTTSQAANAPMPGETPFSGMMETAKELGGELDYKPGQYSQGITTKPSAFKMNPKSPATKKLQGDQGSLPQHLQAAIKAAPGKMRSGFKMKGYGKK